jgi:ketopantoate reductase
MRKSPRVLLVGAGAVGQVFAKYLQAAGCEVAFLVKEAHAAEARAGFTLQAFRGLSRTPHPAPLEGVEVLVSLEDVASRSWEQVWLCVSSTALRAGDWVQALAQATPGATWVTLQPAIEDRAWLLQHVPAERLVSGVIPFLSFAAPLRPGDVPASGTAYWFPPLARGLFSGPSGPLEAVTRTLRAGGYPAARHRDVARAVNVPSAVLTVFVAGLEAAGWRFGQLLERGHLARTHEAAREAVRIAAAHTGTRAGAPLLLLRRTLFRLLPLGARLVPFDLEAYLRVHFTKVHAQTRLMLEEYVALGRRKGLPVAQLESLLPTQR